MDRRQFMAGLAAGSLPWMLSRRAAAELAGNAVIISGFPAGGIGDLVSRPLAETLRGRYATHLLVDNKVGAGGRIAAAFVKRASPDGLTILQIPRLDHDALSAHLSRAELRPLCRRCSRDHHCQNDRLHGHGLSPCS